MMNKKISINIPNPCTENWDQMTQADQGKHCASCNRVVIDFSGMTDAQIIKILMAQKGKKVCGNFYNTQLARPILYVQQKSFPKWPAMAAMLVAGLFQLSAGTLNAQREVDQKIYSRSLAIEKNPQQKEKIKTEPASDSLITYSIRVFDEKTKEKLAGISVSIDSIGVFVTDAKGEIKLSLEPNKVPKLVRIQFSSWNYEVKDLSFAKSRLARNKSMEIYLKESERYMMKGDVSIEETH
jgi:hypothetical protein